MGRFWRIVLSMGIFVSVAGLLFLLHHRYVISMRYTYGFTFSSRYATSLGFHAQEVLEDILQDFHPTFVRLPLYWDTLEPVRGTFSWDISDALVAQLHDAHVSVHMVVGAKVPRWPECFLPDWITPEDTTVYHDAVLTYVRTAVTRYAPRVDVWQVENEPFFSFGRCPSVDIDLLRQEIALVRSLDPTARIQVTVSGEQQLWTAAVPFADRIGVSLYRHIHHPVLGIWFFPLSPAWYQGMRALMLGQREVVFSEVQMEPWFLTDPRMLDPAYASRLFTVRDAQRTVAFAQRVGFREISFWGVEWWYYLRKNGYPALWNTMQEIMMGE